MLHLCIWSWGWVLSTLPYHSTTSVLAAPIRHHGSEGAHPLLQVGMGGVHLLLPLLPLMFVVLQLVFVRVRLKLLVPQVEGAVPVLKDGGELLLLHLVMPQLHVGRHRLDQRMTKVRER